MGNSFPALPGARLRFDKPFQVRIFFGALIRSRIDSPLNLRSYSVPDTLGCKCLGHKSFFGFSWPAISITLVQHVDPLAIGCNNRLVCLARLGVLSFSCSFGNYITVSFRRWSTRSFEMKMKCQATIHRSKTFDVKSPRN